MSDVELVKLKNGSCESKILVAVFVATLRNLFTERPIHAYELVSKARDSTHKFFGRTGEDLQKLGLVESNGEMHESVRNVVLSAVQGDGFDMKLGDPVAS
jgi:hypothetical protein